ncbi:MAG: indolepyruvate oxidoreductase subunit beta [Chloroflexi bacterium]|nr:indolepyruvate oxidoreductase subunit beta [Chloroflexota bacterium]
MDKVDFLMVGVGGQGIILASDVVAQTGLALGYDVKKSEIHGMSQRGGSVESHVRWGQRVCSPLAPMGQVDYLVAFEVRAGARWAGYLRPGGVAVLNMQRILPLAVASGTMSYPDDQAVVGL